MDKNERAEKLLSAIGEIDCDLIKKAEEDTALPGKTADLSKFLKPLTVVAAAIVIVAISITAARNLMPTYNNSSEGGNMMNGHPGTSPENSPNPNGGGDSQNTPNDENTMVVDGATLTLLDRTENVYTFRLVITKAQEAMEITLRGEGTDEWGEHIFVISTTASYAELTHIPKSPPKITVNGESVRKIPTAPGEYTVTVDLSGLESEYLWRNYFTFSPFGNILR